MKTRAISHNDAQALSAYFSRNQAHFSPWEPLRPKEYHSLASWQNRLQLLFAEPINEYWFVLDSGLQIVGHCTLSNIIHGPFQACYMGYGIDAAQQGKGLMPQLCQTALDFAFNELRLNRVMANYMPANLRSANLLQRLGFEREGIARRYLKINGQWQDHILTAKLATTD
jgi:ribosomal-protein-alanine N-acetyltransferase